MLNQSNVKIERKQLENNFARFSFKKKIICKNVGYSRQKFKSLIEEVEFFQKKDIIFSFSAIIKSRLKKSLINFFLLFNDNFLVKSKINYKIQFSKPKGILAGVVIFAGGLCRF